MNTFTPRGGCHSDASLLVSLFSHYAVLECGWYVVDVGPTAVISALQGARFRCLMQAQVGNV